MSAMPIGDVSVEVVNHASVIIRAGDVALLTDPWYVGQPTSCGVAIYEDAA